MKTLKLVVISFFIGAVLSVVPISVYAGCAKTTEYEGTSCYLTGESCSDGVCVCSYNCGAVT